MADDFCAEVSKQQAKYNAGGGERHAFKDAELQEPALRCAPLAQTLPVDFDVAACGRAQPREDGKEGALAAARESDDKLMRGSLNFPVRQV